LGKKLSMKVKLSFALGDFGFSAAFTVIGVFFLFYLSDIVKINPGWVGIALLVAKIWDAVIDPFIGNISDKTKSRWGRRRPFLLFLAVPFGVSFFFMWYIPSILKTPMLLTLVLITFVYMLHITFYSGMSIPYSSLTAELTDDYDERTSLTAWRMGVSIIAGLLAAIAPTMIVDLFGDAMKGYAAMGAVFGFIIIFSPLAVVFGCKEHVRDENEKKFTLSESIKLTFQNKPFVRVLFMTMLTWLAIDIVSMVLMFFMKYVLDLEQYSEVVLGLIFISAAAFLPFWVWFSKKAGKKKSFILGLGTLVIVLMAISFLGEGMMIPTFILAGLAGFGVSAAHVIPYSIVPDCIEYDEMSTGQKRAGAYYGVESFMRQLSASLGAFIAGMALEWSGYIPDRVQVPGAVAAIKLLLGVIPGIMIIIAIIVMIPYKIGRKEHEEIKDTVARNRQLKDS